MFFIKIALFRIKSYRNIINRKHIMIFDKIDYFRKKSIVLSRIEIRSGISRKVACSAQNLVALSWNRKYFGFPEKSMRFKNNLLFDPNFTGENRHFCDIFNQVYDFQKIARYEEKLIVLSDLGQGLDIFGKIAYLLKQFNVLWRNISDRIFSGKSNILNQELMSSKCVEFVYYKLKIMKNSGFRLIVY